MVMLISFFQFVLVFLPYQYDYAQFTKFVWVINSFKSQLNKFHVYIFVLVYFFLFNHMFYIFSYSRDMLL